MEDELHSALNHVDLRLHGQTDLTEFIQVEIVLKRVLVAAKLLLNWFVGLPFLRYLVLIDLVLAEGYCFSWEVLRLVFACFCGEVINLLCLSFYPSLWTRQRQGENISGAQMHEILREVDVNSNGLVELDEFLQVDWTIQKSFTNRCNH